MTDKPGPAAKPGRKELLWYISTNNGRYLYEIIEKQGICYNYIRTAGTRPFITTIAGCKEYIDEIKEER